MIERLAEELSQCQEPSGGWGYRSGIVWTEPTALATLALLAAGDHLSAVNRGREWLLRHQRPDGGWPPQPKVDLSTSVTSLALLALAGSPNGSPAISRGTAWLLSQTGQGPSLSDRIRTRLTGQPLDQTPPGWSWFPGTASWVAPTSMALIALSQCSALPNDSLRQQRIAHGRDFLMGRRCADGGWNHGGTSIHSEGAQSYPETTGLALTSLRGADAPSLSGSLALAERMFSAANSAAAESWLTLGLRVHGRSPQRTPREPAKCWTTNDRALTILAAAPDSRPNPFGAARQ